MTNTADPNKHKYFAKFSWPRVISPKITFPLTEGHLEEVERLEKLAISQIKSHFHENPDEICAIIIEPIQAEGGDNHFRGEFLQALRQLADENDAMLIFDEVQTGVGLTGRFWGHEHFDVRPDLLAFGKKMQVCGMLAGRRLDEEPDNVFHVASRINSTWGGSLADMVRCERYLQIIEEDRLVDNAARVGAYLLERLQALQVERPDVLSNARGRGLMCAIDFPDGAVRDAVRDKAYDLGAVILACGRRSLRFRPPLDITRDEVDEAMDIVARAITAVAVQAQRA
jgi:L-lysine 6-transaminase